MPKRQLERWPLVLLALIAVLAVAGTASTLYVQQRASAIDGNSRLAVSVLRQVAARPAGEPAAQLLDGVRRLLPAGARAVVGIPAPPSAVPEVSHSLVAEPFPDGRRVDLLYTTAAGAGTASPAPGAAVSQWLSTQPLPGYARAGTDQTWVATWTPRASIPAALIPWPVLWGLWVALPLAGLLMGGQRLAGAGRKLTWPGRLPGRSRQPASHGDPGTLLAEQRRILVAQLADISVKLPDSLGWQAELALEQAGCRRECPDGEWFDPQRHHAVGVDVAADHTLDGRVSRTLRPGYSAGEDVIVLPQVAVFRPGSPSGDGTDTAAPGMAAPGMAAPGMAAPGMAGSPAPGTPRADE